MMKIIYLHQYFNTPEMSGGVRSYDVAKHLVDNGHTVEMVTTNRSLSNSSGWLISNEGGINAHWLSLFYSNKLGYFKRLLAFFLFAYHASKKGSTLQGDVVFATSTPLTIAIPALYISWKKSIPMVFEVRDLWPDVPIAIGVIKNPIVKYLAELLESYTYKKSKAVIVLSDGMKSGVIKAGCEENKVVVIPNFSNRDLFNTKNTGKGFRSKRAWLKDSPLLVYTGAFGIINGVDYLVDIAEQLALLKSDIKILLIGGGKQYEDIILYAQKKNVLNNNLFIESNISKLELPQLLAAADLASNIVINVPEVWNNSANKFFDALASGTPILTNGGGWQADLINTEDIGIATFGLTLHQAALKINEFLHNKEKLSRSSKKAQIIAEKYFDKDDLVKKIEQTLLSTNKKDINFSMIGLK
jgi:glycosyltransferase involved in cell wall biosynthesis